MVNPPAPIDDSKSPGGLEPEIAAEVENSADLDEKAKFADYKADAVEAENAEHNMGVLEAVRAYPMASFWAFVMSFTIVSCTSPPPEI
jgi:SP family general alpha glucoside:H+ symporter-like MFS transporter